jgi:hypothetical protein
MSELERCTRCGCSVDFGDASSDPDLCWSCNEIVKFNADPFETMLRNRERKTGRAIPRVLNRRDDPNREDRGPEYARSIVGGQP